MLYLLHMNIRPPSLRSSGGGICRIAVWVRKAFSRDSSEIWNQSKPGTGTVPLGVRIVNLLIDNTSVRWRRKLNRLEGITPSHISQTTGAWSTPLTISPRTRKRSYSANVCNNSNICSVVPHDELISLKMYYEPHASRSNFTVLTSAHVTKMSLSKVASGEATVESVIFVYEGNEYRAFVKKEVILSAGYASCSPRGYA